MQQNASMHDADTAAILVHTSALFRLALGLSETHPLSAGYSTDIQPHLQETSDAVRILHPVTRDARVEVLQALYLDRNDRLIEQRILNSGTETRTLFSARQVLQPAMQLDAHGIILAHNHPCGTREPSTDDIRSTYRLVNAARPLGIHIRDHIILTQTDYFSMYNEGVLASESSIF